MKHTLFILALFTATIQTFAQSPRIKLNQITKDTVKGSVLISSPSDSGMVYSRDFYIAYGLTDTVLILYGDTLAATSGIISSVLSDGVTITGDGTSGNELKVDTATVISTIQGLVDTLTNRGYLTSNQTITLSGDVTGSGTTAITATVVDDSHNHIISNVDFLQDSLNAKANDSDLANYVTLSGTETITGAKTFTSDLNVDAKIAMNDGGNSVFIGDGAGAVDYGIDNRNVGIGYNALNDNTSGIQNTAVGYAALAANIDGQYNAAIGYQALSLNTSGSSNVAISRSALLNNLTGNFNVGVGRQALQKNIEGDRNLAIGYTSLYNLESGDDNQGYGYAAGRYYGSSSDELKNANNSLFLGTNSRASADSNSNEIVIGRDAIGNGSNSVTIGNDGTIGTATSKIVLNGVGSTGGTNSAVYITSGGELTTNSSDERLKTNINALNSTINTVMNLNPVKYNYYDDLENESIGFIAQELEIYYPNLVFTNPISNYKGVHYHLFAPILTKAIQEQQAIIETQEQKITDLETTIQALITRIENLENK